jgi:hypothetical protein
LDNLESNGFECSTPTVYPHPAQGWRAAPTLGLGKVDALNPTGVVSRAGFLAGVRREALEAGRRTSGRIRLTVADVP